MLSLSKRFFSAIPAKAKIYHCVGECSLLPKKLEGKVRFNPGIAIQTSLTNYQDFLAGNGPGTRWPVSVYFRTNEKAYIPDGISEDARVWDEEMIEAEILGYSKDGGVTVHEVTPLDTINESPKP